MESREWSKPNVGYLLFQMSTVHRVAVKFSSFSNVCYRHISSTSNVHKVAKLNQDVFVNASLG